MNKIAKLKEYIDNAKKIIFFGSAGVSTEVLFQILEVKMICIISQIYNLINITKNI